MLLICICLLTGFPLRCSAAKMEDSELYARSACLLDADSGRVLYAKNGEEKLPMASTTKIMTCIIALEEGRADDLVTVSKLAASQPKVKLGAAQGEQFLLNDLLYALMLDSDNDVAVMVAEHIGQTVEGFAEKMNLKAIEIGCRDTYFISPSGLDAQDEHGVHSTTAADLARIMKYCINDSPQKEMFLEITRMPSYTFWNHTHTQVYNCTNHNAFLGMMDGALSGKTGFTSDAGYCYVGALRFEGRTFIVSVLACGWPNHKGYKWSDVRKLMTYGLENYRYRDIFEYKALQSIPVRNGQYEGMRIGETAMTELTYGTDASVLSCPMLLREEEKVRVEYQIPEALEAPVKDGQQVGKVQYFLEDELIKEYPVFAKRRIDVLDFAWCLEKVEEEYKM
ncbi:MAG: D-alanyl-D-alanine carboxypeptidase [Clostridia bacterium]|nr:D-alanyl-D-alanine carboxypeptidase [Clostridia bacterium]